MPYLKTYDIKLYYRELGSGEPLLLIMGAGADSRSWAFQIGDFAKRHRVVVFDNRGSGRTDAPEQRYSIEMMARDTVNLMDGIGVDSAHILGLSMGGMIAQELAIEYPNRVKSLMLAATTACGRSIGGLYIDSVKRWQKDSVDLETRTEEVLPLQFTKAYLKDESRVQTLKDLLKKDPYPQPVFSLARQVNAATQFDARGRLSKIVAPTLVFSGDEDAVTPIELSEELAGGILDAQIKTIRGAHALNIENHKVFNDVVMSFLGSLR